MAKLRYLVGVVLMMSVGWTFAAQPIVPSASYDVGFSPRQGALDVVLKGIGTAQKQILVAAYEFTSKPIAGALVAAQRRGVRVFVVADLKSNGQQKGYGAAQYLASHGIQVRLNGNYPIFHHKFLVIDNDDLELGSFNYTAAAERNAENVLLLWHVPTLAMAYMDEWKSLWDESTPLPMAK
jgi:phosphatidylserine/phosphatidylglycerophosphate/cardiolipin synthase-like enzyme